jgi:nucleotide-binding universal stress UspA family protein
MDERSPAMTASGEGPVLFAYDGSDLAKLAIEEAGRQLCGSRDAMVLTVWQPGNVGFKPAGDQSFDAYRTHDVKRAAEDTAAEGAAMAERAGFRARSMACHETPFWKCIVDIADERNASLIVLGSHGRAHFRDRLLGSVAGAVAAHSGRSVLIVHRGS